MSAEFCIMDISLYIWQARQALSNTLKLQVLMGLLIRKSTFCQKVTVHKGRKSLLISNLENPACAYK